VEGEVGRSRQGERHAANEARRQPAKEEGGEGKQGEEREAQSKAGI